MLHPDFSARDSAVRTGPKAALAPASTEPNLNQLDSATIAPPARPAVLEKHLFERTYRSGFRVTARERDGEIYLHFKGKSFEKELCLSKAPNSGSGKLLMLREEIGFRVEIAGGVGICSITVSELGNRSVFSFARSLLRSAPQAEKNTFYSISKDLAGRQQRSLSITNEKRERQTLSLIGLPPQKLK